MPYIQLKDQQFPLGPVDLKVGAFEGAEARLPGEDPSARAVLRLGADGVGLVSRGNADAVVHVNGVLLGAESVPLLHGDRIELGGHELRYGADQEHETKPIPSESVRSELRPAAGGVRPPSAATGGRVISLVDGREYAVPLSALTIDRRMCPASTRGLRRRMADTS